MLQYTSSRVQEFSLRFARDSIVSVAGTICTRAAVQDRLAPVNCLLLPLGTYNPASGNTP